MGRSWPQPGEPLFTDEDVEEVLDYLEWEDGLCDGCGQPRSEAFDPARQDQWTVTPIRCHACAARDRAAKDWDDRAGIRFAVQPDRGYSGA